MPLGKSQDNLSRMKAQSPFEIIEGYIRGGDLSVSKSLVKKINWNKLSRGDRSTFANLARRADLPETSVRCLRDFVRPKMGPDQSTELERLEYGASLIKLGALPEAIELLSRLSLPMKWLQLSFAHMRVWNYQAAEQCLRNLLIEKDILSEYQSLIVHLNLVACLTFRGNVNEAQNVLERLNEEDSPLRTTKSENLAANAQWHIMQSQIYVQVNQFELAEKHATTAIQLLSKKNNSEIRIPEGLSSQKLIATKWLQYAKALSLSKLPNSNSYFAELRAQAVELKMYELVRDCDFYTGLLYTNISLLQRVYYGTPNKTYRSMIERTCEEQGPETELFCRAFDSSFYTAFSASPTADVSKHEKYDKDDVTFRKLDLLEWTLDGRALPDRGKAIHRLVFLLTLDLYQPPLRGEVFSCLFPDEYYEFESAKLRLSSLVYRANSLGSKFKLFKIYSRDRKFFIELSSDCGIKLYKDLDLSAMLNSESLELELLRLKSLKAEFGINEACKFLATGKTKARKVIEYGIQLKKILKLGQGKRTTYQFINS